MYNAKFIYVAVTHSLHYCTGQMCSLCPALAHLYLTLCHPELLSKVQLPPMTNAWQTQFGHLFDLFAFHPGRGNPLRIQWQTTSSKKPLV